MKQFLISSYTGSGVAWLLNFFLELDILVYRGGSIYHTWQYIFNEKYKLQEQDEILKQWCPVLLNKSTFKFRDNIAIEWSHAFPNALNTNRQTILLTRDGRDTIYSQYKREAMQSPFDEMLQSPCSPFNIDYPHTWALFYYLWDECIAPPNKHHISFEQIKSNDPFPYLIKLLNFLGIQRSDIEIRKAIESSSFKNAQRAEQEYRKTANKTQFQQVNRRGITGEYKSVMKESELNTFLGFPNSILKKLNYSPHSDNSIPLDIEPSIKLSDQSLFDFNLQNTNYDNIKKHYLIQLKKSKLDSAKLDNILKNLIITNWLKRSNNPEPTAENLSSFNKIFQTYYYAFDKIKNQNSILIAKAEILTQTGLFKNSEAVLNELHEKISNPKLLQKVIKIHILNGNIKAANNLIKIPPVNLSRNEILKTYLKGRKHYLKNSRFNILFKLLSNSKRIINTKRRIIKNKIANLNIKKINCNPSSSLIKQKMVLDYASIFSSATLIETGTFLGEMVNACKNNFDNIYSIELNERLAKNAQKRFQDHQHITIFNGDSKKILPKILNEASAPILFWLDAHYSGGITAGATENTPIMKELEIIFKNYNKNNVILIDDARLFGNRENYPSLVELEKILLNINNKLLLSVKNDIIIIHE